MSLLEFLERKSYTGILLFALLVMLVLHIPLGLMPLGRDQGVWSSVGFALTQGDVFFKDILHFNLPGLGFVFAFFMLFTDDPRVAVALVSFFGSAVTAVSMAQLLRFSVSESAAKIFLLFFALIAPPVFDYWNISQKDFMSMAFVLSASLLMHLADTENKKRLYYIFAAGFFVAVAAMFKPIFGVIGIPMAIAEAFRLRFHQSVECFIRSVLSLTVLLCGFLLLAAIFFFYLYMNGALENAYHGLFQFAVWYSQSKSPGFVKMLVFLLAWTNMTSIETPMLSLAQSVVWLPLVFFGLYLLLKKENWQKAYWLYIPLFFSMLTYFVQQKGFPYHAMPWIVCSAACAAIAVVKLYKMAAGKKFLLLAITFFLLSIVVRNIVFSSYGQGLVPVLFGVSDRQEYLLEYYRPHDSLHPNDSEMVSEWVEKNSNESDRIVSWGIESQMHSLSHRRSASIHYFSFFLDADIDPDTELGLWQKHLRKEYIESVKHAPPKFFLFTFGSKEDGSRALAKTSIHRVPGLQEFVQQSYRLVKRQGRLDVYQYKQ